MDSAMLSGKVSLKEEPIYRSSLTDFIPIEQYKEYRLENSKLLLIEEWLGGTIQSKDGDYYCRKKEEIIPLSIPIYYQNQRDSANFKYNKYTKFVESHSKYPIEELPIIQNAGQYVWLLNTIHPNFRPFTQYLHSIQEKHFCTKLCSQESLVIRSHKPKYLLSLRNALRVYLSNYGMSWVEITANNTRIQLTENYARNDCYYRNNPLDSHYIDIWIEFIQAIVLSMKLSLFLSKTVFYEDAEAFNQIITWQAISDKKVSSQLWQTGIDSLFDFQENNPHNPYFLNQQLLYQLSKTSQCFHETMIVTIRKDEEIDTKDDD